MEPGRIEAAVTPQMSNKLYRLPYANSAIESFLVVAENAAVQASMNKEVVFRAMSDNESTMTDIVPAFPNMHGSYTASIVYSTRSLMLSAESAYQAQSSVCEAISAAIRAAQGERDKLQNRILELGQEIQVLDQQTASLRQSFTQATSNRIPTGADAYGTEEAKRLLQVLEAAYQKHDLSGKLSRYLSETEANLVYLDKAEKEAQNYLHEMAGLAGRARDEWKLVLDLFKVAPEQFEKQTETLAMFQERKPAAPVLPQQPQTIVPESPMQNPAVMPSPAIGGAAAMKEAPAEARPSAWAIIWSYLKIIIVAFLVAFVLRAYVFDITMVDGTSMHPTLADGDKLVTAKINYYFTDPQRGDIVVLNAPDLPGHDYIKRIIGMPNERITIRKGTVYIDGRELHEPYLNGLETLGEVDLVIPDGYYFVMGDNRPDSRDSREEKIGVISRDDINGKAILRLLPIADFGTLY